MSVFWAHASRVVPAPWRFDTPLRTWLTILRRKRLGRLLLASCGTLVSAMALTSVAPYDDSPFSWGGILYAVKFSALAGILFVMNRVGRAAEPVDISPQAPSPTALLRTDRGRALRRVLIWTSLGVLYMIVEVNLKEWSWSGLSDGLYVLLSACWIAVHYGIALTAWGRWLIARTVLAARGRLPWRLLGFLEDAYRRGLLRRRGSVYEFRHARLQEVLCQSNSHPVAARWDTPKGYGARLREDGRPW
jgi:hypothetical protein